MVVFCTLVLPVRQMHMIMAYDKILTLSLELELDLRTVGSGIQLETHTHLV